MAIQDSIGRVGGTAGHSGNISNDDDINLSSYTDSATPRHIASYAVPSADPPVSQYDVLGGSPLFSFNFTTFNFTGNRQFIIQCVLDPTGSYGSSSQCNFSFAVRKTSSSSGYTSTNNSDYVTTKGSTSGGTLAANVRVMSDIVTLEPNSEYYIWAFGELEDVSATVGYQDGSIQVFGLNR